MIDYKDIKGRPATNSFVTTGNRINNYEDIVIKKTINTTNDSLVCLDQDQIRTGARELF